MKNLICFLVLCLSSQIAVSQVAIGKASVDGSGILDFSSGGTSGIILPYVTQLPTGSSATNGTIIVDASNLSNVLIKIRQNDSWMEINEARNLSTLSLNSATDVGEGAIIGAETSSAKGVLVLESSDKALILPKVSNVVSDVKSPVVGTMVYDLNSKSLAIFDGEKWNFWK